MPEAVIVAHARSPIGRAGKGSLKDVRPDELSRQMVAAALAKVPNIIQLTDGGDNRRPFWGPTGQRLGFSSMRPPHSSREQYVVAIDGSGLLQVTGDGVQPPAEPLRWAQLGDGQVATSPDGLQVCFH